MTITGNENPLQIADMIANALEVGWDEYVNEDCEANAELASIDVTKGFQPYITLRLRNGAEWQITPVRAAWPDDGTSAQFADVDEHDTTCRVCGKEVGAHGADDYRITGQGTVCDTCWALGSR